LKGWKMGGSDVPQPEIANYWFHDLNRKYNTTMIFHPKTQLHWVPYLLAFLHLM
jgi:hypothetical protein